MSETPNPLPPALLRTMGKRSHPALWQGGIEVSPCAMHEEQTRDSQQIPVIGPADDNIVEGHELDIHSARGSGSAGVVPFDRNKEPNETFSVVKRRKPVARGLGSNMQTRSTTKLRTDIEALQNRIQALEGSEKRLKKRLAEKRELIKEVRGERDEARTECIKAEEALAERENTLEGVTRQASRYRGWWLTEYCHLKRVLELVPVEKDVGAIASEARDRFLAYTAALETQK